MTREEAKLQLLEYCPQLCGNEINAFGCNSKECEIGIAIETLQEPERKWIPVSERLPEKDGYYFVTKRLIDGRIQTDIEPFWTGADWWKSEFHFAGISLWEVLAWQPLPECWKGESNG